MSGRGGRGGRGGGRGGRGGFRGGPMMIAGTEVNWDLTGLDIKKAPAERFPPAPPVQAPPATADEREMVQHFLAIRDRIHEGPFYTVLNDGMKSGLKRKNQPAPTEATLFNPFSDNQTYSSRYLKVYRKLPDLGARPYVTEMFPPELRSLLDGRKHVGTASKKRKILGVSKINAVSQIERLIESEQNRTNNGEGRDEDELDELDEDANAEEEEADDYKPDAVDDDDNWSAVSSGSEDADDDYNAEQYFDNGEDEEVEEADPYENTYE